jgi:hypothetical protein
MGATTLSTKTFSIAILSIMTITFITLSITIKNATLSMIPLDTFMLSVIYAECRK